MKCNTDSNSWKQGFPSFQPSASNRFLVHYQTKFLLNTQTKSLFHSEQTIKQFFCNNHSAITEHFLQPIGWWQGDAVFLLQLKKELGGTLLNFGWQSSRAYLVGDAQFYQMLAYASQIGSWLLQHQFCGQCGRQMMQAKNERCMVCLECRNHQYPRISPCMIVLVTRGDEILLAKSHNFKNQFYSVLAGFVEPGESVEGCVHREVLEEVGLKVKNLRYIASQNWPYPHALMMGFIAEYDSGEILIQEQELQEAAWFSIYNLPALPGDGAIARHLIDTYLREYAF